MSYTRTSEQTTLRSQPAKADCSSSFRYSSFSKRNPLRWAFVWFYEGYALAT